METSDLGYAENEMEEVDGKESESKTHAHKRSAAIEMQLLSEKSSTSRASQSGSVTILFYRCM